jgi:hypothetical protein
VVEHLVYTEGVGGSKPSPPIFFTLFLLLHLLLLRQHGVQEKVNV